MSVSTKLIQASAGDGFVLPEIGDPIGGGFFAGVIDTTQGNIIAADDYQNGERYMLIVSPKSYEGYNFTWDSAGRAGESGSFTRWDGLESTENILAKDDSQYEAFEHIRTIRTTNPVPVDNGSDWYLPAMDELELLHRNLKPSTDNNETDEGATVPFPGTEQPHGFNPSSEPASAAYTAEDPAQTSVTAFQVGGAEAIDSPNTYWCSTDPDYRFSTTERGQIQYFRASGTRASGHQSNTAKTNTNPTVRPVRRIEF